MQRNIFAGRRTSRTIMTRALLEYGKVELALPQVRLPLPENVHAVNVFTAVEASKTRRRLINEPLLNAVISAHELPRVSYPQRLERRQALRYMRYMIEPRVRRLFRHRTATG
eukprot:gene6106-biopygen3908